MATVVLPTLHVPPPGVATMVMVLPTHTDAGPLMPAAAITVNSRVTKLLPTVYVMVTVPAETPVTMPVEVTVAIAGLLLLHVPPGVVLLNGVDEPTQVPEAPVIGPMPDVVPTVNVIVTKQPLPTV